MRNRSAPDTSLACIVVSAVLCAASAWAAADDAPGRALHPFAYLRAPSVLLDPWYGYGPCDVYDPCMSMQQFRAWERRRERERELSRPPQTPPPMGIEAWHGWPGNAQRRMPDGDPANARAEYGESGTVKEQFERSGEFLPQFLDGSARPR